MTKGRLEAFSDGVIAILITIMMLELRQPAGPGMADLRHVVPAVLCYLLSFVFLGIYWNNHHHMLAVVRHVNGWVLWANLNLLFWLSLVPYATYWLARYPTERVPTIVYGALLLASGCAYSLLVRALLRLEGPDSELAQAVGRDFKGQASLVAYAVAVGAAEYWPWVADLIYVLVALAWIVPDPRIERRVHRASGQE